MPNITEPGTYLVTIRGAYWQRMQDKPGDPDRMWAVLPGYVGPDEAIELIGRLPFTGTPIIRKSKRCCDISNETLIKLGMRPGPDGLIDPSRLAEELEGRRAKFVVEWSREREPALRVRYVNPPHPFALGLEEARGIFARLANRPIAGPEPPGRRPVPGERGSDTGLAQDKDDLHENNDGMLGDDIPF